MIWSVSTFSAGSGITFEVKVVKGSAMLPIVLPTADGGEDFDPGQGPRVADDPGDGRRGGGKGRSQECPPAAALAPLEVPVRRADRVLAGRQLVAVHGDAHGAARLAPLRAGRAEDLGE